MKKVEDELFFLALGGSGEIGMNVNLYGTQGKWVMVDCGMTFADPGLPGVELVLPDLSFIEDRRKDLLAIVITHGHEDHIGAIPYLAADLGVPIYASPFTTELIRLKLEEEGISHLVTLNKVVRGEHLRIGPFGFHYVPLAHSIPDAHALLIDTPHGRIFHTGDWKLDDQPVLGVPAMPSQLRAIGERGVLALVCDSTNVFNPNPSGSEGGVRAGLHEVIRSARGRVLVTSFASNAARLQSLAEVAAANGRRLCVAGRSLDRMIGVARSTGHFRNFPDPIDFDTAMALPPRDVLIVATGGQGEPRAALARIAARSHPLTLDAGDMVIFSSRQIPGNELAIGRVQNQLAAAGVEVVTERQAHVHVSGHPSRPELEAMYQWIRPEILIPVHGEMRHMVEQARIGLEAGIPEALVQTNGTIVRLAPNGPKAVGKVPVGRLVLDGDIILPADGSTMTERRRLSQIGLVTVALAIDSSGRLAGLPEVRTNGLPVEEERATFAEKAAQAAGAAFRADQSEDRAREAVRLAVRRIATEWTGKKPQVDVMIVRV